jgi:hypothetical protein
MSSSDLNNSSRARGGRGLLYATLFLLLLFGGAALWTWLTLSWSYSDGTRAGVLQKFSHRGWLCKTQEGDLALYSSPGIPPQIWTFSVRDPAVAAQIKKVVGERVQLHYTEHPGIPSSCFADTRYFVDEVNVLEANPNLQPGPPAAAPPASAPPASAPAASAQTAPAQP